MVNTVFFSVQFNFVLWFIVFVWLFKEIKRRPNYLFLTREIKGSTKVLFINKIALKLKFRDTISAYFFFYYRVCLDERDFLGSLLEVYGSEFARAHVMAALLHTTAALNLSIAAQPRYSFRSEQETMDAVWFVLDPYCRLCNCSHVLRKSPQKIVIKIACTTGSFWNLIRRLLTGAVMQLDLYIAYAIAVKPLITDPSL